MAKLEIYDFVVADRAMVAAGKGYSFRSYTDRSGALTDNPGSVAIYDDGSKDTRGNRIGKAFSVNQSHYKLQARDGQKDYVGLSLLDFFLNAPFCEGSPNGDYTDADGGYIKQTDLMDRERNLIRIKNGEIVQHNVKIRLMETELDAKLALDTATKRAEAQMSVVQLDDQTLSEAAAMIGVFGEANSTMRYKVMEFAGKRPIDYFDFLKQGDRSIRALIRKSLSEGILHKKGDIIFWKETLIGEDENRAVATLSKDEVILKTLQELCPLKIEKKPEPKKKNAAKV
jgi:hypothetical protein